jgi:hypothetical protein
MAERPRLRTSKRTIPDGRVVIKAVLDATKRDVTAAEAKAVAAGNKKFKKDLNFAIAFAKHMGDEVAGALGPDLPGIISGEKPSRAVRGMKRVDVKYATPEAGLGLALSFKSVHFGEEKAGDVAAQWELASRIRMREVGSGPVERGTHAHGGPSRGRRRCPGAATRLCERGRADAGRGPGDGSRTEA